MSQNNSATKSRSWITDKRITPPHLKGLKPQVRKNWRNMMKEFNQLSPAYQKHKQTAPILKQIRNQSLFKDIKNYDITRLRPIHSNVMVSFSYKSTTIYKSNKKKVYVDYHSHSFVSTYSLYKGEIEAYLYDLEERTNMLSPIYFYKTEITSKPELTPTSLPQTYNEEGISVNPVKDTYDELEDFLDLDMNGKDEINGKYGLDDNFSIKTTDKYDRGINRCVYDYLIGYYGKDFKVSYWSLWNIFHPRQHLIDISDKIKMWEKETNRNYNEEIRSHNAKIEKAKKKYMNMTSKQVEDFLTAHPKQKKEHSLIYTHEPPVRLEVKKWNVPDKYLEHINDKKVWGVSIRMIMSFCNKMNIPMYALNQNNKCIKTFIPETHSGYKSLAFKMVLGHFYGIDCSSTIFKIAQINSKNKSTLFSSQKKVKKVDDEDDEEKQLCVKEIETEEGKDGLDLLLKMMEDNNLVVANKNIIMKDRNVCGFVMNDTKYIIKEKGAEKNWGKELDLINNRQWDGEHIIQKTRAIFKELCSEHISDFNDQTQTFFNMEGIKNRVHIGLIDNEAKGEIQEILSKVNEDKNYIDYEEEIHHKVVKPIEKPKVNMEASNPITNYIDYEKTETIKEEPKDWIEKKVRRQYYQCFDINKCYSSILKKPLEEWFRYDFKDVWMIFDKEDVVKVQAGLYFVKTDDTSLFHTSNIYSSSIVNYGLNEGIITGKNIKFVLPARNTLKKDYFIPFIQECLKQGKNDKGLGKTMLNLITGICGKTSSTSTTINITKYTEEMVSFLQEEANTKPFVYTRELGGDKIFFYGNEKKSNLQEHSLPIYLQILDQSNIKLYEMIKKCGANADCIYRKTDCILMTSPKEINLDLGEDWGEYSIEHYPKILMDNHYETRKENGLKMYDEMKNLIDKEWKKVDIIDSSEYEKIYEEVRKNKGFMLLGRAGTGKSYAIQKIDEIMKGEGKTMKKIAFTNKASLNIGGTTIHKFLKLNKEGLLLWDTINAIKSSIDLIVIDEVSMVSSFLWRRLFQLQDKTNIPFLLVGDFRQIPPVEEMIYEDYKEHPTIKLLGGYSFCELEKIHRYDDDLANITKDLDGMMKINKSQFQRKIGKRNICYTNATRKRINQLVNVNMNKKLCSENISKARKCEDKMEKKGNETINTNPTQDIFLYEGLPMIARITHKDMMVNNETFTIKSIDPYEDGNVVLITERPDEEGDKYDHEIEIERKELQKYFLCAYCITTHKSQGDTIQGAITIHDWDLMDKKLRYTAITRAKKLSDIYMM